MNCNLCNVKNSKFLCGNCFVPYCSTICQSIDWKNTHYEFCGVETAEEFEKQIEDLHLNILQARANKKIYFIDEDRFIEKDDKPFLRRNDIIVIDKEQNITQITYRYFKEYSLLGSPKKLDMLILEYRNSLDRLMSKRIFFKNNPTFVVDDTFKWTPIQYLASGNQGTVIVVCNSFSCGYVAKISPYYKDKSEKEADFYEKASEIGVAPTFVESFKSDNLYAIITERFDGNLLELLLEFNKDIENPIIHQRAVNVISQAFNCIFELLNINIVHKDTKVCNFLYLKDGDIVKIADFGLSVEEVITKQKVRTVYMEQHIELFMLSLVEPENYSCGEMEDDPLKLKTGNSKWYSVFLQVLKENSKKWKIHGIAYIH